jgi:hypothetical protein
MEFKMSIPSFPVILAAAFRQVRSTSRRPAYPPGSRKFSGRRRGPLLTVSAPG